MKARLKLKWRLLAIVGLFAVLPTVRAYYDPAAQRWLNRDPLGEGGGRNLYGFISNNPLSWIDTDGRSGWEFRFPRNPEPPIELPDDCAERIAQEVNSHNPHGDRDPSRRWTHCVASCRISRECAGGRFTAWIAGDWWRDPWWQTEAQGSDPGDRAANRIGRGACKKEKSCEESCNDALNSGSLYPDPPPPPPRPLFPPLGF